MADHQNEYINSAEKIAAICASDIEREDFSDIDKEIKDVLPEKQERVKYVFSSPSGKTEKIILVLAVVFAILLIYFAAIGLATMLMSSSFIHYGAAGFVISTVLIIFNAALAVQSAGRLKFYQRYDQYCTLLNYCTISLIDDLGSYSKIKSDILIKDLNKAVDQKLIPQGHFGTDNLIFIISDDENARYEEKRATYDRYYRKQLEERLRMQERTKEMQDILDNGKEHIDKIHGYNEIIGDKAVSEKLDRMEQIISMIFYEVDVNPSQAKNLGLLSDYYLPTAEKFMETYIDLGEKGENQTVEKTKREIEQALDLLNTAFEAILDRFYQEKEMDISSDISALEIIMKQEGLTN